MLVQFTTTKSLENIFTVYQLMTQSSSNICPQYPSSTTSGDIRANLQTRHSLDLATDANGPRNFTMSDLSLLVISR
ncbi:hypothetical protein RRG08_027195 [Elysia crispata]|uniref:Uncharacterized protein n=1 Tax=Elysia crispata TaxID=231223 RepID=A0AAE1A7R2_9GAST|nr:hypothetical protein RRG08_027195 [Elysia crispata]